MRTSFDEARRHGARHANVRRERLAGVLALAAAMGLSAACTVDEPESGQPSCMDGELNGAERDVDCGGPCAACRAGQRCAAGADCDSGVCDGTTCREATCGDGVINAAAEACDDGNVATEPCPYGVDHCEVCDATCELVPGTTAQCGDGVCNAEETCATCAGDCMDALHCSGYCAHENVSGDVDCNPFTNEYWSGEPCPGSCHYVGAPYEWFYCSATSPVLPSGASCTTLTGEPGCALGLACDDPIPGNLSSDGGVCRKVCCSTSDCPAGLSCQSEYWVPGEALGACL